MRTKKEENSIKHGLGLWFIGAKPSRHDILEPFEPGKLLSVSRILAIAVALMTTLAFATLALCFPLRLFYTFFVFVLCLLKVTGGLITFWYKR